jgi:hypothetical protein
MRKRTIQKRMRNSCLSQKGKDLLYFKMLGISDDSTIVGAANNRRWIAAYREVVRNKLLCEYKYD